MKPKRSSVDITAPLRRFAGAPVPDNLREKQRLARVRVVLGQLLTLGLTREELLEARRIIDEQLKQANKAGDRDRQVAEAVKLEAQLRAAGVPAGEAQRATQDAIGISWRTVQRHRDKKHR